MDEYMRKRYSKNFCRKEGMEKQNTVKDILKQNGLVERMNKTLLERLRRMLSRAKVSKTL